MIGKVVKPIGIVLAGILCIYLDGFAAEKDAKKSSEPAKKAAKAASKKEDTSVPKKEEAAPAKQEDDSKKVVATVNGENISQQDVNQMLNRFGKQVPEEQIPVVTKQIVDGLITQKLIMQFIRDSKIEVSQAEIEKELNKVREDIKSNP
ncbi:MAG: SurA N-terminal domain-containing protein, partial [Planctomycetes bacterium]|nr:SurA N-terminal domain-containing protein [Planctomycetota bacterium]